MKYRHDVDGLENIILGERSQTRAVYTLKESIYLTCPEQENPQRQTADQ